MTDLSDEGPVGLTAPAGWCIFHSPSTHYFGRASWELRCCEADGGQRFYPAHNHLNGSPQGDCFGRNLVGLSVFQTGWPLMSSGFWPVLTRIQPSSFLIRCSKAAHVIRHFCPSPSSPSSRSSCASFSDWTAESSA